MTETFELVLKAARRVEELRTRKGTLQQEISLVQRQLRNAEAELKAILDPEGAAQAGGPVPTESYQERLLELLQANPAASHADLAIKLYGSDDRAHRKKIYTLIWNLRKKGLIAATTGSDQQEVDAEQEEGEM